MVMMKTPRQYHYFQHSTNKESIEVALAETGGEARHYGRIGGEALVVDRLVRKLRSVHRELVFV